jgi:hypothetical protein
MIARIVAPLMTAFGLWLGGCASPETASTAVMLRVDADADVKLAMRALNLRIYREQGGRWDQRLGRAWETDARFAWPAELPIVPADDALRVFEVLVEARASDGRLLAETRAVTGFAPDRITELGLFLESTCFNLNMECQPRGEGEDDCHGPGCKTCRGGECVATRTSSLPDYQGDDSVRVLFRELSAGAR